MNDATPPDQVIQRWNLALAGYAAAVAAELTALGVRVIDYFVDITDVPFWIDLAVVDPSGNLVEFYFCDDLGWMQSQGSRCGRLATTTAPTPSDLAAEIAIPPSTAAAEIVSAAAGPPWPVGDAAANSSRHTLEPAYLAALLCVLEKWAARNAPNTT